MNPFERGASKNYREIWSLPFFTHVNGKIMEAFCLDAEGYLVYRCGDNGRSESQIPWAVRGWVADSVVIDRLRWDIDRKVKSVLAPCSIRELYLNGIETVNELYAGETKLSINRALLESAIEAHASADAEIQREIELELSNCGVYPFNSIINLNRNYYEVLGGGVTQGSVFSPGWISRDAIIAKAKTM